MKISNGRLYYSAYGLNIDSALTLPELPSNAASSTLPDLRISFGKVGAMPPVDETGCGFWIQENRACYRLESVGAFLVSEGKDILVDPCAGVSQMALRLCILGPALALALYQQGLFILHASAVAIDGAAVAFLGGHGWGKSTMAALLHARGYPVITDDVTAVDLDHNTVVPSFPQLKLWPEALRVLSRPAHNLPQVHPDLEKRAFRFSEGFASCPLPLQRLYVLSIGQPTAVEILQPGRMFEEIIRHWYGVRFGPPMFDAFDRRAHFLQASQLTRTVPVRRLQRPATLMDDPELPQVIEKKILQDLEYLAICASSA